MKKIGILGVGTMGCGIARVIAQSGYKVVVRDIKKESIKKGLKKIRKGLDRDIKKSRITEKEKEEILRRIISTEDITQLKDVDMVIETVTENMDIKKKVFEELDSVCDENTILVSNTSALSITKLASQTGRSTKVLGVHFSNPVPVMQLVELIRGSETSNTTFKKVKDFIEKIGKTPIEVNESPGFVVNRILIPMINEAIFALYEGVASAKDIDMAMKLGANHPIGPLALVSRHTCNVALIGIY